MDFIQSTFEVVKEAIEGKTIVNVATTANLPGVSNCISLTVADGDGTETAVVFAENSVTGGHVFIGQ